MCSNAGGGSQILYMQLPLDGQDGGAHVALSIHTRTYVYIYMHLEPRAYPGARVIVD
jgi:hypothetical protein